MSGAVAAVLLVAGTIVIALASVGVLAARTALDRLHYVGLAATWGTGLIAAGVVVGQSSEQTSVKAILLAALIWCASPLLTHVQASLAYHLEFDDVRSDEPTEPEL